MSDVITYDFRFADGQTFHFEVPLHGWRETAANRDAPRPDWTLLAQDRCPNCPLDPAQHRYCPAAVDLHAAAAKFSSIVSYARAHVDVVVGERTYSSECDMNTAVRSLFGLYLALSGCPVTGRMRPMALRHLPFSSMQETLGRAVGHYLTKQYLVMRAGGTPDWQLTGLGRLYEELDEVNMAFIGRLRRASERDSNLNALCGLSTFARFYSMGLDDLLDEEKALYLASF